MAKIIFPSLRKVFLDTTLSKGSLVKAIVLRFGVWYHFFFCTGGFIIFDVVERDLFHEVCGNGKLDAILHKKAAEGCWEYLLKRRTTFIAFEGPHKREYSYAFVLKVL